MASSITIAREIEIASKFIRRAPLVFTGTNDPAFAIGDWVRGFMLSPPFSWRWNRTAVAPFTLTAGTQDYTKKLDNFGWLEQASITDNTPTPKVTYQIGVSLNLAEETVENQPTEVAARLDDGNGNITFRMQPIPDKAYTLNLTYQNAAPIFKSLMDTFAPIPDYLHYLYHTGFLAKCYEYLGDDRFPATMQLFVRQLVAANEGLTQSQVNIFLADQIRTNITSQSSAQNSQIGNQARSLT